MSSIAVSRVEKNWIGRLNRGSSPWLSLCAMSKDWKWATNVGSSVSSGRGDITKFAQGGKPPKAGPDGQYTSKCALVEFGDDNKFLPKYCPNFYGYGLNCILNPCLQGVYLRENIFYISPKEKGHWCEMRWAGRPRRGTASTNPTVRKRFVGYRNRLYKKEQMRWSPILLKHYLWPKQMWHSIDLKHFKIFSHDAILTRQISGEMLATTWAEIEYCLEILRATSQHMQKCTDYHFTSVHKSWLIYHLTYKYRVNCIALLVFI